MSDRTEIEERWIDAWEAVYQLAGARRDVMCLLPDGTIVDLTTALGWIQEAVYAHDAISVATVWIAGTRGIGITAVRPPARRPT